MAKTGLHASLWLQTRAHHEELDYRFNALRLDTLTGYQTFLSAHSLALGCVEDWLSALQSPFTSTVERLSKDVDFDLRALGTVRPVETLSLSTPVNEIGVLYVIGGSSLGARVLLGQVQECGPAASGAATRYLCNDGLRELWRTIKARLAERPATGPEADRAIRSAQQTFECFGAALQMARRD